MSISFLNGANIVQQRDLDETMRARKIRDAWLAYNGDTPKPLKNKPGQVDDNVCLNMARLSVDTTAFYLFGKDVEFEIADSEQDTTGADDSGMMAAPDTETPADVYLENVWKSNKQTTFLLKVGLNGAVCGHAFVKMVEPRDGRAYPRLINLDPACMRVEWLPDDIEEAYRYVYEYSAVDPATNRPRNYRQTTERAGDRWVVIDEESAPDSQRWTEVARNVWPYAWPPVIDCQNLPAPNEFWGISDLETDTQELNASINFVLSNTNRILRYHAHPKTLGKGFDAKAIKTGPDEITVIPTADGDIWNLEMMSDLGSSLAFYEKVKAGYHETTQVPEVTTGKFDGIGALSGLALGILYGPLLRRTEVKRRTYGDMLAELNRRLLAFGGFGEQNDVATHWPELLPSDPAGEAATLQTHAALGVSQQTVLTKLGYEPEIEMARSQQEATVAAASMAANAGAMAATMQQDEPSDF